MRYVALCLLPLASATLAADADDRGPGIMPTRQGEAMVYPATGFSGVGLGFAGTVDVRTGDRFSVRATGPAAAFANLRVVRQGDAIDIGHRYRNRRGNDALERQVRFQIVMPRISDAAVGGSGTMTIERAAGNRFAGSVGGSGSIRVAQIAVDRARISIGGSGNFSGSGAARVLEVNMGGSGNVTAPALRADSAVVSSAGSGAVRASVSGQATVSIVGSGSVDLGPAARCTVNRVGSGRVRCS